MPQLTLTIHATVNHCQSLAIKKHKQQHTSHSSCSQATINSKLQENGKREMKTLILILAITAFAGAIPVPKDDLDGDDGDSPLGQEKMLLDLEEMGLEFFPNGTIKMSSMDDLLRIYNMKKDVDDYAGNKTEEHFEEEEDQQENEDGRSKRSIFDDDERLPIPNSNLNSGRNPFCALAEVSNGCTAIFIGPNHALTAGRCVYDRANSRFRSVTGLRIYRRRNCNQYGTSMTARRLFTVNGYALQGRQEYDYGMIVTTQRSPCWVSFGYQDPWFNRGFELLGYPTDKRTGCIYHPAYLSPCSTSSTSRGGLFLQHRCDTSGMIGAPLMSESPDNSGTDRGQKSVYGVNVYTGSVYNYGPRINRDRFYQFVDWMRQTGYNPTTTN